jgi:hypothetical protein
MAEINGHAGDFGGGVANANFDTGLIHFPWRDHASGFDYLESTAEVAVADENSVKRLEGTIGWGATGALLLGPVGLLAGLLLGGKRTEVTFVAKVENGKKMLATTAKDTYKKLPTRIFKLSARHVSSDIARFGGFSFRRPRRSKGPPCLRATTNATTPEAKTAAATMKMDVTICTAS